MPAMDATAASFGWQPFFVVFTESGSREGAAIGCSAQLKAGYHAFQLIG